VKTMSVGVGRLRVSVRVRVTKRGDFCGADTDAQTRTILFEPNTQDEERERESDRERERRGSEKRALLGPKTKRKKVKVEKVGDTTKVRWGDRDQDRTLTLRKRYFASFWYLVHGVSRYW